MKKTLPCLPSKNGTFMQYHDFMPCARIAIHNMPTSLYTGLWKWWSSFSTFDFTFDSRYSEPSPVLRKSCFQVSSLAILKAGDMIFLE